MECKMRTNFCGIVGCPLQGDQERPRRATASSLQKRQPAPTVFRRLQNLCPSSNFNGTLHLHKGVVKSLGHFQIHVGTTSWKLAATATLQLEIIHWFTFLCWNKRTKHNETKLMETFAALMLSKAYQGVLTSELSAFPLDFNVSDQPALSLWIQKRVQGWQV
jgi:hypothetical protein